MSERVLGVIGWVGTAFVFVAVVLRFAQPERQELWWWLAVAGLVVLVLYSLGRWREVLAFFGRRQTRYGTLATTSVLIGVGIVVAVNYISARQNVRWDLTAARQYSLSDQTVRVLESLEAPIRVIVFAQELDFPRYRDRLAEYEYVSDQVSLEFVDVDKNPLLARQYEVQSYGTVVFDHNGRIERVVSDEEQELTNALIKAVEGEERSVYFVQGHGERSPEASDRDGLSSLAEALARDNLTVETVVLAQTGRVPEDADVLVIAGPVTNLLPTEIELLGAYLEQGGKLLVMLDPPTEPDSADHADLIALLAEWGVAVGQDVVVDVSGVGQLLGTDATVPVAASYPPHPITDRFNLLTAFPLARSVTPANAAGSRVAETIVETSPRSWAERDLDELASGEVAMNEDAGDVAGPISIAAVVAVDVEQTETTESAAEEDDAANADASDASDAEEEAESQPRQARLVVFGDSDFATNGTLGIQGNSDLMLNSVNWLAQQENLISIRPRAPEDRRITLTADQQTRVMWLSLILVPGVILGTGVYTWWRRR